MKFKGIFLLLCYILMFFSCRKDPSFFDIKNLNNNKIGCFGHAGMGIGFKYPINSFQSLETCFKIGVDGSEMDIQLSKDGIPVLFHNEVLEHTTSLNGKVNSMTLKELQEGLVASPFSSKIRIQTLESILVQFKNSDRKFTLDCKLYKDDNYDEELFRQQFVYALLALIIRYNLKSNTYIESSDEAFLSKLKVADSKLQLFIYCQDFREGLEIANKFDLYGITMNSNLISAAEIEIAHQNGKRVTLFGLLSENDNITAIEKSPDFLQSDRIIHLLKIFDQYKKEQG